MNEINDLEILVRFLQNGICPVDTDKLSLHADIRTPGDEHHVVLLRRYHSHFHIPHVLSRPVLQLHHSAAPVDFLDYGLLRTRIFEPDAHALHEPYRSLHAPVSVDARVHGVDVSRAKGIVVVVGILLDDRGVSLCTTPARGPCGAVLVAGGSPSRCCCVGARVPERVAAPRLRDVIAHRAPPACDLGVVVATATTLAVVINGSSGPPDVV
mmetsp:Transcript_15131/g.36337  ORF Transcript_15131/g.36337 Transcript_15131/m.36337 type:complete len:211 (-) Transcript_15131:976-1608(-)